MKLNQYIDHTILKCDTTAEQIKTICKEAIEYGFASVCVNGSYAKLVSDCLKGSPVKTCVVVGFPLGAMSSEVKAFEADLACRNGAKEIDMVLAIGHLKNKDFDYVQKDIKSVVEIAEKHGAAVKVILETCLLSDEEKVRACELSVTAGATFVKTSTGFSTAGATYDDVKLMKDTVKGRAFVKASGGVRDYSTAKAMILMGADRIGTSNGVYIMNGESGLAGY